MSAGDPRGRFFWLLPLLAYVAIDKLIQLLPRPWPHWAGIALPVGGAVAMTVLLVLRKLSFFVWLFGMGLLSMAVVASLDVPWRGPAMGLLGCGSALLLLIVVARRRGSPAGE